MNSEYEFLSSSATGRFTMGSSSKKIQIRFCSCWLLVPVMLLVGCSTGSPIKSQRLAPVAEPGKELGIIYQMTKPQFTIAFTQPTDATTAPKYTLNVEFVPDVERRFAVSSNPGTFSESDITVSLNSNGAMTALTHTSRELVTPTIKAVGDFTTSLITAAATVAGGAMMAGDTESQAAERMKSQLLERWVVYTGKNVVIKCAVNEYIVKEEGRDKKISDFRCEDIVNDVVKCIEEKGFDKCIAEKDLSQATPDLDALVDNWSKLKPDQKEKIKPALNRRLRAAAKVIYENLQKLPDNYTAVNLAAALKPKNQDQAQVRVLKALAKTRVEYVPPEAAPPKQYNNALTQIVRDFPDPKTQLGWERELVVGEIQYAVNKEDIITLLGYSQRVVANSPPGSAAANIPDEQKKKLSRQAADLATYAVSFVLSTTDFPNLLGPLIKDKTPAQRIYDQVKDLQLQIFNYRALLLYEKDARERMKYQNKIDALTCDLHKFIGAEDEYAEILKLKKIIKDGPPKATIGVPSSPLQEYATARAQLAALNEAVTLKLGKVAADAADTPPAKQPEWSPTTDEKAFCWNYPRETMEQREKPSPRILVPQEAPNTPPVAQFVSTRVAKEYGAENINSWPKYVVVIGEVKP
jgi:hypothetical protein